MTGVEDDKSQMCRIRNWFLVVVPNSSLVRMGGVDNIAVYNRTVLRAEVVAKSVESSVGGSSFLRISAFCVGEPTPS